jgi:hypothetical protein
MKHRIKIWPSTGSGQTIARPIRFGSVIKALSGTSIQLSQGGLDSGRPLIPNQHP